MPKFETFETPVFVKPGDCTDSVITFGKSPDTEASDLANGVARFGGTWRAPSYPLAYMKSAAILINHGLQQNSLDEIALPAFFMQRHALELFIKHLLSWLHELADFRVALGLVVKTPISKRQRERFEGGHNLGLLLDDLQSTSVHLGFDGPPTELTNLVHQIKDFETSDTWSRYASSKKNSKKGGTVIRHVEDEVELPIVAIQRNLEAVHSKLAYRLDGEETYENLLYGEWLCAARSTENAA